MRPQLLTGPLGQLLEQLGISPPLGGAQRQTDKTNVTDWFQRLSAECHLDPVSARALDRDGFVVVSGPMRDDDIDGLAMAYDRAMNAAEPPDKRVGRTSTRVHDLVNRDRAFDGLFEHPPVLAACCQTIRQRVAAGDTGPVAEPELVAACGPAGAVVVYNGSVRHGHGPNHTDLPRRSIQGAYIRREAVGFGLPDRTHPETIQRISPLAKYLLGV